MEKIYIKPYPCLDKTIGPCIGLIGSVFCAFESHSVYAAEFEDELNGDTIFFTSLDPLEPMILLKQLLLRIVWGDEAVGDSGLKQTN